MVGSSERKVKFGSHEDCLNDKWNCNLTNPKQWLEIE